MKLCKTAIQNIDGSFCIEQSKERFTAEEFEKIQSLMPAFGWIIIVRPKPEEITNPAYVTWKDDED